MRVLHVIDQLAGGGAETSLRELLPRMQTGDLEHAVAVLKASAATPGELPLFQPARGLSSRSARLRHVLGAARAFRPDLLHTTLFESDLAGRLVGKVTGTPVLTSLVNAPEAAQLRQDAGVSAVKVRVVTGIDRLLARRATFAFHAITQAVADHAVRTLGIDPARIHVVPRGRSITRLGERTPQRRQAVRRALGLPDATPVVLNLAREEPQKGQLVLMQAFEHLREDRPSARLIIAGRPGRASADLDAAVAASGLSDSVLRLGFREDVGDLLSAADLLVLPSFYEGLGGSLLEAMAMGVPIVASDLPAISEVLDAGRCGLLVPPGDAERLAGGLATALDDEECARERASAAQQRFSEHYTIDASARGMVQLYRRLADELA